MTRDHKSLLMPDAADRTVLLRLGRGSQVSRELTTRAIARTETSFTAYLRTQSFRGQRPVSSTSRGVSGGPWGTNPVLLRPLDLEDTPCLPCAASGTMCIAAASKAFFGRDTVET